MLDRTVPLSRLITKPFSLLKDRPVLLRTARYTVVGYGVMASLNALAIAEPLFPLAVGTLMVIVVAGFGVHGRKLGTFPFSPENRRPAPQEGLTTVKIARTTHG